MEHIGMDKDRTHILVRLHFKCALGAFVHIFKSVTAKQLFKQFFDLKKNCEVMNSGAIVTAPALLEGAEIG